MKKAIFFITLFILSNADAACVKSNEAVVVAGNDACPNRHYALPDCAIPASFTDSKGEYKQICTNQ
jgi:hypothetical protein